MLQIAGTWNRLVLTLRQVTALGNHFVGASTMNADPIYTQAKMFGTQVVAQRSTLPMLAMSAARAVVAGEVEVSDAERIYRVYFDAKIKRSPSQKGSSQRVQISKLRQIMMLAEQWGQQGVKILARTVKIHEDLARSKKIMPLYPAMVEVARHCLGLGQVCKCTDEQIVKVITHHKRR